MIRKVQEISTLRGDLMKQRVEALVAGKKILTPEQQKKVRAFMRRAAEMRRGRMGGMGMGAFRHAPRRQLRHRPGARPIHRLDSRSL